MFEEDLEDDVQFVSEAPLRPVLEYIDLLSDGDDEDGLPDTKTIEQRVDRQRAHAVSTLDRLAQQVAVEKQERAEKCKAFKEKIISQQAHGRHELSVSNSNSDSGDAKRCVDIWLKMPGLKSGSINSGSLWRRRSAPAPVRFSPKTCPVINCGRVYDNIPLLQGHLKRFDHSPCDPTITLKGNAPSIYACLACGRHFDSQDSWKHHMQSKQSSDGHSHSQTYQMIVCFACPTCYFLFNSKDECLKHMNERKHNSHAIFLTEQKQSGLPVPVPRFAKQRLIALCKDISFSVKCTVCSQRLNSHMEATAHFNVHCRDGCALATADQSVADIMRKMAVIGHCSSCPAAFLSLNQMEEHKERMKHDVDRVTLMDRALLYYSNYSETRNALKGHSAKRKRLNGLDSQVKREKRLQLAWFCECGLRFTEEDTAKKHLQAANQIFHKCAVCGKLMGESSITRLHMSRFHGGGHLTNFLYHCRKCKVEMPRMEDIMAHVGISHRGHNYYEEREDTTPSSMSPKPSTSAESEPIRSVSPPKAESWLCRMCEDLFDCEDAVQKHCSDLSSHSFQRFSCGHCPQKFFKDSTLRRHCANEHGGDIVLRYYCGLCDSMLFDTEGEFQEHYNSLHSQDYYCLETSNNSRNATQVNVESPSPSQLCPCMSSEKSKEEQKRIFTKCMKLLASENKCSYCCRHCTKNTSSYAEMKTHILLKHKNEANEKSFDVMCTICSDIHKDVPSFHSHYHERHCQAEPCTSSHLYSGDEKQATSTRVIDAEEIFPQTNAEQLEDVKASLDIDEDDSKFDQDMKQAVALSLEEARKTADLRTELEEALKRSMEEF